MFVGISTSEYAQLLQRIIPREELGAYVLQGSALNAAAGRLSYFYGLNGPCSGDRHGMLLFSGGSRPRVPKLA